MTRQIQEALAGLTYGIQNRKGFILLTGEVGTGKTTLLNRLLDWLHGQRVATAYIFNSRLDVNQLFDFIMAEFEIPCDSREKSQVLLRLNQWLLERYRAGETAVLIVDEAQNLSPRSARGDPACSRILRLQQRNFCRSCSPASPSSKKS